MKLRQLSVAALLAVAPLAQASQFYLFPVKELEGVSEKIKPESRPLIDKRVRDLIAPQTQSALLQEFAREIAQSYPGSVVHAAQVRDALRGSYRYQDDDSLACGDGFAVPLRQTYGVVLGVTRASWYEVQREAGRVELLIPVTLNLQLVRPDSAKVVYAISETVYTPFAFTAEEMGSAAMHSTVSTALASSLQQQTKSLVQQLRAGFQPKETSVRVVGRSNGVWVVDQGFEVGFKTGDEPLARHRKTGKEVLFKVLSTDSGYAVLRLLEGDVDKGDEFNFLFETQADDARKPRVLPLTSEVAGKAWTQPVAELFAKEVGFRAGFQITPVDVNFQDTMESITRQARCVPWDKYPSAKTVFNSRNDHPDYFMRFEMSRSAMARQSGLGAVKTVDQFMTNVSAQVVDARGHVLFSELGSDLYRLEKTAGSGLSTENAYEVSLKNATQALARRFVDNVRFESGEFTLDAADKSSLTVAGLTLPEGAPTPVYEVLRPLDVKVGGKPTFWRLSLGEGTRPPVAVSGGTQLSYSRLDETPRAGDLVRIRTASKPGQQVLSECKEPFRGTGSLMMDPLLPLVRHAAYRSGRFMVQLAGDEFTGDANRLLEAGFFKQRLQPAAPTPICLKTGYSVKQESQKCEGQSCAAQIFVATTVILEQGSERVANYVQAEKVSFDGFIESQGMNFVGLKAYESVHKSLTKLTDKLNSKR